MSGSRAIASKVAARLVAAGAEAVVLGGSVPRDAEHIGSDIDICAVGDAEVGDAWADDRSYVLEMVEGRLVAMSWRTPDEVRALLDSVADAGAAVPAWRTAEILADVRGRAAMLQQFAHAWRWARIDAECDAWVSSSINGYAEEVFRLAGLLDAGRSVPAAVIRSVLALRLPLVVAIHERLFYESENALWELVADTLGTREDPDRLVLGATTRWGPTARRALGLDDATPDAAARGALELYCFAASIVAPVILPAHRDVIEHAVVLASRAVSK